MRSNEREDPKTRIQKTRDRADQLRTTAAEIRNSRIRASMLKIAKTYDSTADLLERIFSRKRTRLTPATAETQVAEAYEISDKLRDRLVVVRDNP